MRWSGVASRVKGQGSRVKGQVSRVKVRVSGDSPRCWGVLMRWRWPAAQTAPLAWLVPAAEWAPLVWSRCLQPGLLVLVRLDDGAAIERHRLEFGARWLEHRWFEARVFLWWQGGRRRVRLGREQCCARARARWHALSSMMKEVLRLSSTSPSIRERNSTSVWVSGLGPATGCFFAGRRKP